MPNPNFRADLVLVQPGQCTALRWDVDDIEGVYLWDGYTEFGVTGHEVRQICPSQSTTYRLRIVKHDGGIETFDIPIVVQMQAQSQTPAATGMFNFWADRLSLQPGQCTHLRWDVEGVSDIWFNEGAGEQGVSGHEVRTICPQRHTTYSIHIRRNDGVDETRSITVYVS